MKAYLERHIQIALHLLILASAIVVGSVTANYNQRHIEEEIVQRISKQSDYLYELALVTDRNGADVAIETIVADCGRRDEFDALLIKLGSLHKKDLVTLQSLYDSCGNFYAERKALMVSKLERELESYTDHVSLLSILDADAIHTTRLPEWEELIAHEKTRSSLLSEQSILQTKIISLLISGSPKESAEVNQLVRDAQDTWDLLGVEDHTIDVLRENLKK